jgi:glycosyltransferase involved in cell wall biosynthesis
MSELSSNTMSTFTMLAIVKDEARIITRCLTSVRALMDSFIIMDTGSTDGTPKVIMKWAAENNVDGKVIYEPWQSFGYNKTKLIQQAHADQPNTTYFFFLDADEVFITNPDDALSYPTKLDRDILEMNMMWQPEVSIFQLTTLYGGLRYKRWQIVRNNQLYEWCQPVHEYLVGLKDNTTRHIDWLYNLARKEGNSSHTDRYQKDAQMFVDFLKDHPNDARATFYLAQSYQDYGNHTDAIEMYKKRSDMLEGFYQERYISCLRIGRLSKDYTERMVYLTKGYTICPHRLECIYELMMLQHGRPNSHDAVVAYGMLAPCEGLNERKMVVDDLFVESHIYEWRFDFDFAVSCYYTKDFKRGREANERALRKAPQYIKDRIQSNMKFFPPVEVATPAANSSIAPVNDPMFSSSAESNIIVIDNFYAEPDKVREFALKQTFSVKGNYPGYRTECIKEYHSVVKQKLESVLQRKITYWPEGYNSSFQYATEEMHSWLHRDLTDYSAIVYLSPDAPVDSGTKFYRHKALKVEEKRDDDHEKLLNQDTYKESAWELVDHVGNKYNRCVIFRGRRTHISGDYFGTSKEDGRLFQMFFFN